MNGVGGTIKRVVFGFVNLKMKYVFNAFVARYASMQKVLENNFSANLKDI